MDNNGKGLLSYLLGWIGGLIVLLAFKDNDKKATTHACQSITMSIAVLAVNIIYMFLPISIPFFTRIVWAFQIVVIIIGIIKVVNDDDPQIPVLIDITKMIFGSKIDAAPDVVAKEAPKTNEAKETKKEDKKEEKK